MRQSQTALQQETRAPGRRYDRILSGLDFISVALRPINQVTPKNHTVWVLPTLYVSLFANRAYHIIERVAGPGVAAVCGTEFVKFQQDRVSCPIDY